MRQWGWAFVCTKPLYRSYRAGGWRLSHRMCPHRVQTQHSGNWEQQWHRTSLGQYKCTVMSEIKAKVYFSRMLFCSLKTALPYSLTKCSPKKMFFMKRAFWQRILESIFERPREHSLKKCSPSHIWRCPFVRWLFKKRYLQREHLPEVRRRAF